MARRSLPSANCKVGIEAEDPHPVVQSLSPEWGTRDDEARKVRRARREAARHAPCDRHSVFSAVAQTLLDPQGYSSWRNPATTRCSLSPGRIRAQCPARTCPGRTAAQDPSSAPLLPGSFSFLPFFSLSAKGSPACSKVLSRPRGRHPRNGGEKSKSALCSLVSLPSGQTPRASPELSQQRSRRGFGRRGTAEG